MTISQHSKFAAMLFSLLALFSALAAAQLKIGSGNTAFADPRVPRPHTTPCVVTLFKQFEFADFNPKSFTYTPPAACPGPWAKIILQANFSINQGRQFDRTANIWIGPTNVYFGTTSEPSHNVARHWHVERDLTDYSSIFTVSQAGTVDLGNLVNSIYTSVLHGSADLLFFPLEQKQLPPRTADQVVAFSSGATGGTVALFTTTDLLEQTLTLPTNITDLYFDVFAQSQSNDEFWYTCVPNDVANELFSCPGTAFRESEVTIDGTPAGVAPVYPWIYTGGIDPYLWRPIPGVQTMNFQPYRVNLTPFAAQLDDGQPHTIALSVFNADSYFSATASLLLYLDSGSTQVTGGLTENTLAVPAPNIVENIHIAPNGNLQGTVTTKSGHNFKISGYVNTSHGMVTTTVAQNINFLNAQYFKITPTVYKQNIKQNTTIGSVVTVHNAGGHFANTVHWTWPLSVDYSQLVNSDGSFNVTTTIDQYFGQDQEARRNGQVTSFSLTSNHVTPTDTLLFDSSGNFTGNQNQFSAQNYFASDSSGYCFSRDITAAGGLLTSITNGLGCN
jgi:Peptide N-acetyl-beta-D-glucosaminyl asparaginase amidase A